MNKKSNRSLSIQKSMAQGTVYLYVLFLVGVYPLLFRNGYADILDFKSSCYLFVTAFVFGVLGIFGVTWRIKNFKTINGIGTVWKRYSTTDWFGICFGIVITISWFSSSERSESFWGTDGRRFGYFAMLLCLLSYFMISRLLKYSQFILLALIICSTIVFTIAIFNLFQIDVLGMYSSGWKSGSYISTLGNLNSLASYSSIVLPIGMALFCLCKTKLSTYIYGFFCTIGFMSMVASSSDSVFCSILAAFLFLFLFIGESLSEVRKYLILVGIFILSLQSIGMLHHLIINQDVLIRGIPRIFALNSKVLLMIPVLPFLYWGIGLAQKRGTDQNVIKKIKVILCSSIGGLVCIGVIGIIIINISFDKGAVIDKLGTLGYYIYFDESWGSHRGTNWIYSIRMFREYDLKHSLFGYGPGCFVFALRNHFGGDVYTLGSRIIDAHNEIFQFMVTTGLLGVISYLGFLGTSLKRSMKIYKKNSFQVAIILSLIAYVIQGLINNPHIYTTPIMFAIIAIGELNLREESENLKMVVFAK